MKNYQPIEIKLFHERARYYCGICKKRIFKRHKICPHCYKGVDWSDINEKRSTNAV